MKQFERIECVPVRRATIREKFVTLNPKKENIILEFEVEVDAQLYDAILCYDFKNGCSNMRDDPAKTYWDIISSKVDDDTMPALCSKILGKALDVIGNEPNFSAEKVQLDAYLVPLWKEIGLKVFTWGCANQPIRA